MCGLIAAVVSKGCRSARRRFIVALGAVLGTVSLGCGGVDAGSASFPGTVLYESPSSEYQFNLLEPPWRETISQAETIFVVPSKIVTLLPSESDATYSLHIYRQNTDAASALQADAPSRTPVESSSGPTTVASESGSTGVEMSWQETASVYHRDAYINIAAGLSFRMHFSAAVPLVADNMVTQMIASFRAPVAGGK
ncbi:MAG TPA: hypothetical protein VH374_13805 [Polyangia bacterium]|jgi:hypothetical protein|nr:hypothetical protein [Polyangia bacterium]